MATDTFAASRSPSAARAVDWTPYLAGAGIGVLSWIVFAVVDSPIGITTALSQVAGGVASPIVGGETVAQNSYWARHPFALDYGTLFLAGTFLGALISALLSRTFAVETVPAVWRERFGPSKVKRYAAAVLGGALAMYGARMAGGCTSGNGISGGLQLALSGWTFMAVMLVSGVATAGLMFRLPS